MSIMLVMGSVGMAGISGLKNGLLISDVKERFQQSVQSMKKDVLVGATDCGRLMFQADSTKNEALFFLQESWNDMNFQNQQSACVSHKNNEALVNNFFNDLEIVNENNRWWIQLTLKDENVFADGVYVHAFNEFLSPITVYQNFDTAIVSDRLQSDFTQILIPISSSSQYTVQINDAQNAHTFTQLDVFAINATQNMLDKNDPSLVRVERISGVTQSGAKQEGNLEIVFTSPYAKAKTSLFNQDQQYLVKDVAVEFMNLNDASGVYSFFNASLVSDLQNIEKQQETCTFSADRLKFICY